MRALFAFFVLLIGSASVQAGVVVEEIRTWNGPDHTRVVFDLSAPVEHNLFILDGPHRAVVDLPNTAIAASLVEGIRDEGPIERVRTGRRGDGTRVVFDLSQGLETESFLIAPNEKYGHRLVVDLQHGGQAADQPRTPVYTADEAGDRAFVVAIDAGHGGEDPGAIGPSGTYEKDIVLAVAKKLAERVDREPGLRAVLIRDGDYYIGLRERTRKAHEVDADLFISLHADAFHDRRVKGSSVFVLSRNGASSEMARMVAQRENRADYIGGVALQDKDEELASVLVDLSRAHTMEESVGMAKVLLNELKVIGDVHGGYVEQAGFAVLKSLDMPSVLVELAFLSNPDEERRLKTRRYQQQLADGLVNGVRAYAARVRPDLNLSVDTYTVREGDTLSRIAHRHAVSVTELRQANGLGGNVIMAGRTLRIP